MTGIARAAPRVEWTEKVPEALQFPGENSDLALTGNPMEFKAAHGGLEPDRQGAGPPFEEFLYQPDATEA